MHKSNPLSVFVGVLVGTCCFVAVADSPSPVGGSGQSTGGVFATDAHNGLNAEPTAAGAAAVVDGHVISMEDVTLECLHKYRSYVVDQMLQNYILDRECKRRRISASEAEIDGRIAKLRTDLAPATLEDTLAEHHVSMAQARDDFRHDIEQKRLVADQIKPVKMVHCREIVVRCAFSDGTGASAQNRTEKAALAIVGEIQDQFNQGRDFGALAAKYSEGDDKSKNGDTGVLYENILGPVEAPVLDAALALSPGELSRPIKARDGFHVLQAISTDDNHPSPENNLYATAVGACRQQQLNFLIPKTMAVLIKQCHITFVDDSNLVAGKPLPETAAVIDDHPISMKDVVAQCLAVCGPKFTDILVQNYLVDRECERLGITVSESEIDARVEQLRRQCAPSTLDEGLKMHHTTLDGLRQDFRQEIERTTLAMNRVKPTRMVHARVILARANATSESDEDRAEAAAKAQIIDIQNQIKAGKKFDDLAIHYADVGDQGGRGDLGIIFGAMPNVDTAIVNAAMGLKHGEITVQPIKTYNGYVLVEAVSTSDDHLSIENAAYAKAQSVYQQSEAQHLIPQMIVSLIKKSNVSYYVHS
jgi:parvulin-like peptidyl-prolyl isomerase